MSCRPNRVQGFRTRVLLQEEEEWGVVAAGQTAWLLDIVSEELQSRLPRPSDRQHFISTGRGAEPGRPGNEDARGSIVGKLQPHGPWPLLMRYALGDPVVTTGSGPYVHIIDGSDSLPVGLTVEKQLLYRDGSKIRLRYPGARLDSLFMRSSSEGEVRSRVRFLAQQEIEAGSDLDPAPNVATQNEPFLAREAQLLIDVDDDGEKEVIAGGQSFEVLIENNLNGGSYSPYDGRVRSRIGASGRVISGSILLQFTPENYQLYQRHRANDTFGLRFILTRGSYSWRLDMPAIQITGIPTPQAVDPGALNLDMPFNAPVCPVCGIDMRATLTTQDPVLSTSAV